MSVYKIKTKNGVVGLFSDHNAQTRHVLFARRNNIFLTNSTHVARRIAILLENGVSFSIVYFDNENELLGSYGGGCPSNFYNKTPVDNMRILSELVKMQHKTIKKLHRKSK